MATEKRLIDANALLGDIADIMREMPEPKDHYDNGYYSGLDRAFEIIKQAPTVEVVHGWWIGGYQKAGNTFYYEKPHCSICGVKHEGVANYCPQCGAKMDGDGNG